jgi:hypothetical protein
MGQKIIKYFKGKIQQPGKGDFSGVLIALALFTAGWPLLL